MPSKDEVSLARFGALYENLSPWGKKDIDLAFSEPTYAATLPTAQEDAILKQTNQKLSDALEQAHLENMDLWEENTELKNELEELRSLANQPSS